MSGFFASIQGMIGSVTGALKWSGSAFSQAASSDLSDTTAPTSWTPTDQSGAGLTFSSVNAAYCKIGNVVFAYGALTYPSQSDTHNATISLPVAVPNQSYAAVPCAFAGRFANGDVLIANQGASTASIYSAEGASIRTNSTYSGKQINFMLIYPAS
jgi:hypothetical protein